MRGIRNQREWPVAVAVFVVACAILVGGCVSGKIVVNGNNIPELGFKAEVQRRLVVISKSNPDELRESAASS